MTYLKHFILCLVKKSRPLSFISWWRLGQIFPIVFSSLEERVGADSNIEKSTQRNSNEMLIFNPNLLRLATVSRSRIRLRDLFKILEYQKYIKR